MKWLRDYKLFTESKKEYSKSAKMRSKGIHEYIPGMSLTGMSKLLRAIGDTEFGVAQAAGKFVPTFMASMQEKQFSKKS